MKTSFKYEVQWAFKTQLETRTFDDKDEAIGFAERVGEDPYMKVDIIEHETTSRLFSHRPAKTNP